MAKSLKDDFAYAQKIKLKETKNTICDVITRSEGLKKLFKLRILYILPIRLKTIDAKQKKYSVRLLVIR